jgi:hypothetical protein
MGRPSKKHSRISLVADLGSRRVHQVRPPAHLGEHGLVEEILGLRVERGVDRHDVTFGHHRRRIGVEGQVELTLDVVGQAVFFRVMQVHVEGLETTEDGQPDAAGGDGSHRHALEVIGTFDAVRDVPTAPYHPSV